MHASRVGKLKGFQKIILIKKKKKREPCKVFLLQAAEKL